MIPRRITHMYPKISVITATRNAAPSIADLHRSLQAQSYRNFEWLVMDSRSTDGTVQKLGEFAAESPWIRMQSALDFGIYDALNRALRAASGEYYVIAGADDIFDPNALTRYAECACDRKADVVLAKVVRAGRTIGGFSPDRGWVGPSKAFKGSHSVGMLFRRSLHERFGMYSNRFPLLADGYFLKLLLRSGDVHFHEADFVAGTFGAEGSSSVAKLQTLAETWQIQMLTERFTALQCLLFAGKVVVRYAQLTRELGAARKRNSK